MLFLDVVKWFDSEDIRSVRYNDTTMKFFWLGKKLFGGRFLRFMSGPRNETDIVLGKPNLSPSTSKNNFACPSDTMLSHYNPLGYEMCIDAGPGLIKEMIEMTATKKSSNSYVLMFDVICWGMNLILNHLKRRNTNVTKRSSIVQFE